MQQGKCFLGKQHTWLQVLKEDALPSYGVRLVLLASVEEREATMMSMKSFGDHCFCVHTRAVFVLEASDCLVLVVWGQVRPPVERSLLSLGERRTNGLLCCAAVVICAQCAGFPNMPPKKGAKLKKFNWAWEDKGISTDERKGTAVQVF